MTEPDAAPVVGPGARRARAYLTDMRHRIPAFMGLFAFLFGCGRGGEYHKSRGTWYFGDVPVRLTTTAGFTPLDGPFARAADHGYYRGVAIAASDGPTFVALSDHYAKDRARVFHCDTYRKAQEYWAYRYVRVAAIDGADAATFRSLDAEYAKDANRTYFEGAPFAVADAATFTVLDDGFARDRVVGYYHRRPVPGSDGATFTALGDHHARDRAHAYYVDFDPAGDRMVPRVVRLEGADVATLAVLADGYARDAGQAYYRGRVVARRPMRFEVLTRGYAAGDAGVLYEGRPVRGADAATFRVLGPADSVPADGADAADGRARYAAGRRTAPERGAAP